MILEYYNLREQPFGVTPDFRYLYSSATHREALASLLYGLEAGRGFVALIAKPGMGKTTLLFQALNELKDKARAVFVFQTVCTPVDLLRAVLADLGVHETQGNLIELQSKLNEVVTEQSRSGKPLVIVIDEAQNLDDSLLELVRMLSNFETSRKKLIQVVLSGQPQLADKLASPELVQLRQRVSIVACLKPFSAEDTALYIDHRIRIASYGGESSFFTKDAVAMIAQSSAGIPRNINNLCFNALSLGCALKRKKIDGEIVREVIADLDLEPLQERTYHVRQSGENGASGVHAFASAMGFPSILTAWLPKFIAVCAILLACEGAIFHGHRWMIGNAAVRPNIGIPPLAPTRSSWSSFERMPQPSAPVRTIRVTAGQSVYRICAENFGSCDSEKLQEIHSLNSWLSDLDHIESGQKLRVPVVHGLPGIQQGTAKQAGDISLAERGMQ